MKSVLVVGARPNFMKAAPLLQTMESRGADIFLLHTGQHYSPEMSDVFFRELGMRKPNLNLGVGSGPHGWQTGKMMEGIEKVLLKERPDSVIVVGDVNSTLAGALAAAKLKIPVAHVEAGCRSGDMGMPEEINRIVADRVSRWLFTPTEEASANLKAEGISEGVKFVGNIMIETMLKNLGRARNLRLPDGLEEKGYAVVTMHRPENTDDPKRISSILSALESIGFPMVFPVHPRAEGKIPAGKRKGLENAGVRLVKPMGYLDFLKLQANAKFVLTDSGGMQEELLCLKVPCLTMRDSTERPITVENGGNVLVGADREKIMKYARELAGSGALYRKMVSPKVPKFWDEKVSERIARVLVSGY
jgi:UDP-N-acetylglucosamine 2-epimerase (non-hydrolysing)